MYCSQNKLTVKEQQFFVGFGNKSPKQSNKQYIARGYGVLTKIVARSVNLPTPQCHPSIINLMPPKIKSGIDVMIE